MSIGTGNLATAATVNAVAADVTAIAATLALESSNRLAGVYVAGNVAGGSDLAITIRPPAGATWRIRVLAAQVNDTANSFTSIRVRDAAGNSYGERCEFIDYVGARIGVDASVQIDNTYYVELFFRNMNAGVKPYGYSYFGEKI